MTIQQILGNSTEGNAINLTPKIPIFFVAKLYVIEWNLAKIGIWTCVHFRMSPFGNLSYGVFSSVDLFLRRRSPMNTTGSVAGNPKFHHIKTATLTFAESFTLKMFSLHSWNSLTWKSILHAEERTSRKKKFTRLMPRPIRVIVYVWDVDGVSDDTLCEAYEYAPEGKWGRKAVGSASMIGRLTSNLRA